MTIYQCNHTYISRDTNRTAITLTHELEADSQEIAELKFNVFLEEKKLEPDLVLVIDIRNTYIYQWRKKREKKNKEQLTLGVFEC